MKVCNSEAMKIIKELEQKKEALIFAEESRSRYSYRENEEKTVPKYDYRETRKGIADLDARIRAVKHALAKVNCTAKVDGFDMTIGEALVYLAQLNAECRRVGELAMRNKLSRRITTTGVLEYTECQYDPEIAEKEKQELNAEIARLQVAIDRANLNNFLEI